MKKLPKRTHSQKIGVNASDLFSSVFSQFCNVIPVPQDRDLGIDFICEIMEGEYPTGKLFNITFSPSFSIHRNVSCRCQKSS